MIEPILEAVALPLAAGNRILNSVTKYWSEASSRGAPQRSCCSAEQRNNLYLLADQVVAFDVPGHFVEVGCHEGQTARVLASVLEHHRGDRALHLYDDPGIGTFGDVSERARLELSFRKSGLPKPVIHAGVFELMLSTRLPEQIAFAHIDCAFGELMEFHCQRLMRCLEAVYPRMGPGSIGVLMDYHDHDRTVVGLDRSPGVKMACDHFFKRKPECIQILYGGKFSHAFFRKVW